MGSSVYDELRESGEDHQTILKLLSPKKKCLHENKGEMVDLECQMGCGINYCLDCGVPLNKEGKEEDIWDCKHSETYEAPNGLYSCRKCCAEIEYFKFAPEWRYYGASDNRISKDPSRCHYSKGGNKGLDDTFTNCDMEIPLAIRKATEKKYNKIVKRLREEKEKNTVRGKRKKSIVAACLIHVYREMGEIRTADYIRSIFDLKQKRMSKGLQEYYKTFPEDRVITTTPENLIRWQMTLSGIHISHYPHIREIAKFFENSSVILKRSNPQSVSAAIIYYYLCINKEYKEQLGLTKSQFAKKVNLSEITINKLVIEIGRIAKCEVDVDA